MFVKLPVSNLEKKNIWEGSLNTKYEFLINISKSVVGLSMACFIENISIENNIYSLCNGWKYQHHTLVNHL